MRFTTIRSVVIILSLSCTVGAELAFAQTLEAELKATSFTDLVTEARSQGDAARGAILFHQQHMACAKCHTVGNSPTPSLAPDLATLAKETSDESLVESVLFPSKVIRKGYEGVTIALNDGRTLGGILVEKNAERIVLRETLRGGEVTTIAAADIEEIKNNAESLMPAGQVNQLGSRLQFLDLLRYLLEIRTGGAARARELQPSPTLLTLTLPEYEKHLDHAGLIRDWNKESFKRGEAIYRRVCCNCHGTREEPGSLPTSLRFAEGKFKNGSDPLAIYNTLTRGFGFMAAQTWMVPSQKYDVIHYLREEYLKPHNPSQYVALNDDYFARLPAGDTRGPAPSKIEPWSAMDYGPSLTHTFEIPGAEKNFAYKGIAVRLDPGAGGVARGRRWMLFDTDTMRMAAAWSAAKKGENFSNWRGIQFNGEHGIHPTIAGETTFANSIGPGWADPTNGSFADNARVEGRDHRRYGPLPRTWARFRGTYHHEQSVVFSYTVGNTEILESPRWREGNSPEEQSYFVRLLNLGPRERELTLRVAEGIELASVALSPKLANLNLHSVENDLHLTIPAGKEPLRFAILIAEKGERASKTALPSITAEELDLAKLTRGGPPRWPQLLTTKAAIAPDDGPFAADVLTAPDTNPWLAQTRFTGLDFFADGSIAVCSWDGDVWIVKQTPNSAELRWQRIATGMFQPLGLKIIDGKIHVTCRDQLAVLHDLNADGEIDFTECLNNDHQVTEHFHEFAMGLQTDAAGNFYYAKSGRHALPAVVPHHGTLLCVSRDGSQTEILAVGFRAANGVCLNPDGSFVVTDQEGHWNPKNRINWVTLSADGKPKFYGNMFGYHDVTDSSDSAMQPPLCWITNAFDRSPGELLWVDSPQWGALNGSLLNLSYGTGKVFLVPNETVNSVRQGGMIELPIPAFPTGVMRGRFHPQDGQLYLCGMFAWAGSATQPGGLYRLRATGRPLNLPLELHAKKTGMEMKFTEPLDRESVTIENVAVKTWSLKRTANYGSKHFDEHPLEIKTPLLSDDGKTVTLPAAIEPTWCMEIRYAFKSAEGKPVVGTIHNTVHETGE